MSIQRRFRRRGVVLALCLACATALPGCTSVGDPDAAVAAFLAAAGAPDRSMHLESSATASLPLVGDSTFESAFDLVGSEFYGLVTFRAMGEVIETRLASIAGQSFSAFFGAETLGGESRAVAMPDPLARLTRDDLEVVGTDRKEDRDVVHVRVTSSSAAAGAIATFGHLGLGDVFVDEATFDLYIAADGAPVLADIEVTASATGELSGTVEAGIQIRFSRWGEVAELPVPFAIDRFPDGTTFVGDNRFDEPIRFVDADGRELLVEGCSRGSSSEFDGRAVSVEFAADGQGIMSSEPGPEPLRYVLVSAGSTTTGGELPILRQSSPEPCTGREGG